MRMRQTSQPFSFLQPRGRGSCSSSSPGREDYCPAGDRLDLPTRRVHDFFLSIEKGKRPILESISSSLNIHLSDCHRKGRRLKKGMVGIIRLG